MGESESGIVVDVSELTLGDIEMLTSGAVSMAQQIEIIDRILIKPEGGARKLKLSMIQPVIEAVQAEVEKLTNPTTPPA